MGVVMCAYVLYVRKDLGRSPYVGYCGCARRSSSGSREGTFEIQYVYGMGDVFLW